ncbi:acetylcholine receptor subunit alpha-type unc-38-like [Ptychodera flava]|uniref:acetylcholine receptor subunit alpha-type unc-38-like n=1 Tax=Ptychodera flava TaxID=63121 RepID=UPI00396A4290
MISETPCLMNIHYFPKDEQSCYLEFALWGSSDSLAHLQAQRDEVTKENYIPNVQWDVTSSQIKTVTKNFLGIDDTFTSIIAQIDIKRKPQYYVVYLIVPCILVSFLTVLTFCLPIMSPDKINLSISLLLTIYIFNLLVADLLPATSLQMPLLTIYLMFVMILIIISIALSVAFSRFYVKCTENSSPVPRWVKKTLFGWVARLLLIKGNPIKLGKTENENTSNVDAKCRPYAGYKEIMMEFNDRNPNQADDDIEASFSTNRGNSKDLKRHLSRNRKISHRRSRLPLREYFYDDRKYHEQILKGMHTLILCMRSVSEAVAPKKNLQDEKVRNEWLVLARIVDRISLILFSLTTIAGSLMILPRII